MSIAFTVFVLPYATRQDVQESATVAILGQSDAAFQHLQDAITAGFEDTGQLTNDDDLEILRNDPRFEALLDLMRSGQKAWAK